MLTEYEGNYCFPELGINKVGVVILIFDGKGKLFTLKERNNKAETGKVAGQIGIPCETSEKGESFGVTFRRGLREELGVNGKLREYFDWSTETYLGFRRFIPKVFAHVVSVTCNNPEGLYHSCLEDGDGEVVPNGWVKPSDLVKDPNLRVGVKNILNELLVNK
ncbi:MAG: NUDIX hydrolase [Candidatus Microgenomates bacterium]|jgi:hypothetical protein